MVSPPWRPQNHTLLWELIQTIFLYLFNLMLTYKICKNSIFGKQNGGATACFLEPCTWCRHPQWTAERTVLKYVVVQIW